MTITSHQLHEATKGIVRWREISILLPASTLSHCFPDKIADRNRQNPHVRNADVFIGNGHPLLFDLPWAHQYGGCAVPGLQIDLSYQFILALNEDNEFINGSLSLSS